MNPLSHYEFAELVCRAYADDADKDAYWSHVIPHDGAFICIKIIGPDAYIIARGSTTPKDWWQNLHAGRVKDGALGTLMSGFARDVWKVQDAVLALVQGKTLHLGGHSRGGPLASILAGKACTMGFTVAELLLLGTARPGYRKLRDILQAHVGSIVSYRNRRDPVTKVPFHFDLIRAIKSPFDFLYVHVAPFTQLDAAPPPHDSWGPVADHHIELYLKAIKSAN